MVRFETPARITTGQGRQFKADLFHQLTQLTGTAYSWITTYHPAINGMVERFHRQLKAAIKYHQAEAWAEILPIVLMRIRPAIKKDLRTIVADATKQFGYQKNSFRKRHPPRCKQRTSISRIYVEGSRTYDLNLWNATGIYLSLNIRTWRRHHMSSSDMMARQKLCNRYTMVHTNGAPKFYKIKIKEKAVNISVDRLKQAYTIAELESPASSTSTSVQPQEQQRETPKEVLTKTRSGRISRPTVS